MTKIASITVSRKDSVRVKDKWSALIGDKGLLENKIHQLKKSNLINEVVIGTNISVVEQICNNLEVTHKFREDYYCDESKCSANEMILDMCKKTTADIIVWAHCTNPLVKSSTYDNAILTFLEKEKEGYDSLVSVEILKEHLWTNCKKPLNYNPYQKKHVLASQLDPLYKQNGAIFIQRKHNFISNSYFFGKNPFLFVMDKYESLDVNDELDLLLANTIKRNKK